MAQVSARSACGVLLSLAVLLSVPTPAACGPRRRPHAIVFEKHLERALDQGRRTQRPVVALFVAAWCPICHRLKQETLADAAIEAVASRVVWVLVDLDRHLSTARAHGVEAVPELRVFDAGGVERARVRGFLGPQELRSLLEAVLRGETPPVEDAARARSALVWRPRGYRGAGICFSHVGYGPLRLDSQSPFQSLRLGIRPRTPSTLSRGQRQVHAATTWVNVWATDDAGAADRAYLLDFEMLQSSVAIAFGLTDTFEIEVGIKERDRFGGVMDGLIQNFHDLFGIEQNGREQVPRDQFHFELAPPDGNPVRLDPGARGPFSRTLELALQHNVGCGHGARPAFSYAATARLETLDSGGLEGGDLDLGVSVAVSRKLGSFYLYGTVGHAWFGARRFHGMALETTQWTGLAAVEWRYGRRQSLLLQLLRSEGVVSDFSPFSRDSTELTLGLKWELADRRVLEVGLIENIVSFDNSPDFGLHLGFARRF